MASPKSRRLMNSIEIERYREEGDWNKCLKLAQDPANRTEWDQQLRNFIVGEATLELLMEENKNSSSSSTILLGGKELSATNSNAKNFPNSERLNEAKNYLKQCIEDQKDSPLLMDANLLLAKAFYISGDFHQALHYIRQSRIDSIANIDKKLPTRVIKLIAESLSVKGMSLEKISPRKKLRFLQEHSPTSEVGDLSVGPTSTSTPLAPPKCKTPTETDIEYESYKTQSDCLNKAATLSVRYVQKIDKSKGQYSLVNLGNILETALLKSHHCFIRNGHLNEAIEYCRRMLNYVESQSVLHIRQVLAKELAELFIKGVCRASWKRPEYGVTKQATLQVYYGNSLFVPAEYEEELMLLLMLGETMTSRNVVLERSQEFEESRIHSLNDVMLIQDLFTIVFTPFQQFFIENYERSMKFSYEVKHVWFQFALSLIESGAQPLRAFRLLQEVSRMDPLDPVPNLFAAKLCMTDLMQFEDAIKLLNDSLARYQKVIANETETNTKHRSSSTASAKMLQDNSLVNNIKEIYGGSNLLHRIHLFLGVANALIYEYDTETSKKSRQQFLADSLHHLNESIRNDENGTDHLPFFHIGLHMANQRVLNETIKYARVSLILNPMHLPSIQLLILALTGRRDYNEAYDLCCATLYEYPDHMILLYIKAHLEEMLTDNGREVALQTAKHMLKQWRQIKFAEKKSTSLNSRHVSTTNTFLPTFSYDTMSLRMEQTLSEVISMESVPGPNHENTSLSDKRFMSQSSINGFSTHLSLNGAHSTWAFEMQIWLLIIDLFLKLDQVAEAEVCVNDGAVAVFGSLSHQLMYVKGLISKKKGQLLDAKIHFQNAISINPKHAKALQQLGHTYYLLGNQISADKYLKDSINVDSTLHETWSYMGLVLDAIGEHERAFDCHQSAMQLEETSPLLPFGLISRSVLF